MKKFMKVATAVFALALVLAFPMEAKAAGEINTIEKGVL